MHGITGQEEKQGGGGTVVNGPGTQTGDSASRGVSCSNLNTMRYVTIQYYTKYGDGVARRAGFYIQLAF